MSSAPDVDTPTNSEKYGNFYVWVMYLQAISLLAT